MDVFTRSYVEQTATGDPFRSREAFGERFDAYTRGSGFDLVVGYISGAAVGQSWGWPLGPDSAWWGGLQLDDAAEDQAAFVAEDGARTFALSEIMVDVDHAGQGYAHALHDELLKARTEQRGTLLVKPDNERAYGAYRRWGWSRVGTLTPGWDHAPTFDVLIRPLG
ncbi:GNAT family N-acetyltransferase [Nocardia sp. NEAU-351]|uniref:GNAT family N-acetyltransferase n=2 Tax=Nocardia bovistercoris TaxID=2785916 RepID=A0A931IE96_9NOCA|nr:GNAT family N-acetyltransferase [Nocardia bovistercoris]MBH0778785.1 GNAT family N-acetyltransferase [Nocardia bovistercoris]